MSFSTLDYLTHVARCGASRLFFTFLGRDLRWPDGFPQAYAPRVFVDQMARIACSCRVVRRTIIEMLHTCGVINGIKGAVNMTILAIRSDDGIGLFEGQCSL
jgi:hypothetical protein